MFEVTALQDTATRRQRVLLDRINKGQVYLFSLDLDHPKYQEGRQLLLQLEAWLIEAEYARCMYPQGLPEELREREGFCIVCPVPNAEWAREMCPAWRADHAA